MKKINGMSEFRLRKAIFWPIVIVMVAIIVLSFINQEWFANVINTIVDLEVRSLKWAVGPIVLFMFITIAIVIFGPLGKIRMGGQEAKSDIGVFSYWGLCICSSIAIGIVFYGVAHPLELFMDPYEIWGVNPESPGAAIRAVAQTSFEWGWGQFCAYGCFAITIGIAMYNFKQPARVSSLLYMINGKPVNDKVNLAVDLISVFGIVCGVSCSLGTGTMQMASGLNMIFGIEINNILWLIVEAVVVAGFLLMSIGGIKKGIKVVTDKNLQLYIIILVVVIVVGPTLYIFDMFTESLGLTFGEFINNIGYTGGIDGNERALNWQIWQWISVACFSPITGLFFAKISYGRTLREIAIGTSLIPSIFVSIWFTVFGSYGFNLQTSGELDLWEKMQEQGMEATMFELFRTLPGGMIWCVIFMFVIYISFVTLASSATTSTGFVSTTIDRPVGKDEEPPMWIKCTWALIIAASAYIFISFAGIDGAKAISNIGGMPVMLFSALVAVCVLLVGKRLREAGLLSAKEDVAIAENKTEEIKEG